MAANEFDVFCRRAFEFLEQRNVRYLVIGGLAVVVVGEPRTGRLEKTSRQIFLPRGSLNGDDSRWEQLARGSDRPEGNDDVGLSIAL